MLATLSSEYKIKTALAELDCSGRPFVEIAKSLGARIAHGPFSEAMTGKKPFDRETGQKLLDVVDRMRELQNAVYSAISAEFVVVDWSNTETVCNALAYRLLASVAADMNISGLQDASDKATTQTIL